MGEKLIAGLVAVAVVAPLCAVCVLGPAFLGSTIAWTAGWLSGLDILVAAGLAIVAGGLLYGLLRRRRVKIDKVDNIAVAAPQLAKTDTL